MTERIAPNGTEETADWLKDVVHSGSTNWYRRCLSLQRQARGLPAVYPTAFSASQATPSEERIYDVDKWKRGMVGYSYDPRIPGTAGHIFFVLGRAKDGEILTTTNDAKEAGAVDVVRLEFYGRAWGQKLQFASTWLNGYDFKDETKPPKPVKSGNLGEQYEQLRDDLQKVLVRKRKKLGNSHELVKALQRDVERMDRKLNRWK